jgi:hypothetical protein
VELKYLVTGTGRCGTLFFANLLTSMGFPCTHEAVFTTGALEKARRVLSGETPHESSEISRGFLLAEGVSPVAESSYMAAPFLKVVDAQVIHVVRNPVKVVSSFIGFEYFLDKEPTHLPHNSEHIKYEKFIYSFLPEMREEMSQLERASLYYVRWNRMIEESGRVSLFHRIEDDPEKVKELFGFKGECYSNTLCNSFGRGIGLTSLKVESLRIRDELAEISERYGYSGVLD